MKGLVSTGDFGIAMKYEKEQAMNDMHPKVNRLRLPFLEVQIKRLALF